MSPWRTSRRRSTVLVSVALLLVLGLAPPGQAQEDPSSLVEVPVPATPRTPAPDPPDPAATAEAWLAATSDEERRDILLDVLAGIGIGVYTQDGEPILFGLERELEDPWLLDFEVALLSADPDQLIRTSIDDLAATLEGLVETDTGEPLTAEAIATAVEGGLAASLADPTDPLGFPLLLARELVLRESGVDLAEGVPTDLPMGSLAATLLAWDLLWPLMSGEPATALLSAAVPAALADGREGSRRSRRVADTPRTAAACDRIASWANAQSPSIGRSAAQAIAAGIRISGDSPPVQLLHALALAYGLRVMAALGPIDWHYRHDPEETGTQSLAVRVMVVEDLPVMDGACAAMLGIVLPPGGYFQGAQVGWDTGNLKDHGVVDCGATCTRTDADGYAYLLFTPNMEPDPAGLGPEKHDRTVVSARVNAKVTLGNLLGTLPFSGAWRFGDVGIFWHQPYRFELAVDSEIKGTALMRFKAQAKGTIELADPPSDSAIGRLRTTTRPQNADGCRGQTSARGSGSVDFDVHSLVIFPESRDRRGWREVYVSIDSGPEEEHPDTVTFEGCGPAKRFTKSMSIWELHFLMSHLEDREPGEGLQLGGWRWVATDETWQEGGTIATLETRETCQGQCDGRTRFELKAYPKDDDGQDQPDLPPVPPLPPLPGSPDGASGSSEHDEED